MDWTLETLYLACFALGGSVLVLQTLMTMFGGADHSDVGIGHVEHIDIGSTGSGESHESDSGMSLLSVRSIAAFLACFGLVGWGGVHAGWRTSATLGAAFGAGALALVLVGYLFASVRKLGAAGNVDPRNAVGRTARVYLRIPSKGSGKGKVTVSLQGRTCEFHASTIGEAIPTGGEVRIVRQITEDTFEVEALA
jgi:hypothetical protein